MVSDVGLVMLGMFFMANFSFWVGYLAGKRRWRNEMPPVGPGKVDRLHEENPNLIEKSEE